MKSIWKWWVTGMGSAGRVGHSVLKPCLGLLLLLLSPPVLALDLASSPLFISSSIPPQVMLDVSKDQQLYKKAYSDYSDLDGDGQLETGYKHAIDYYGYFDSYKCYSYSTGNQRFEPTSTSDSKYCSGLWSGNFLNWATMTRMDAVRKLLYGGLRSTDQTFAAGGVNALTVLERSYLPTDAHAFAKYYNGADIDRLTPFTASATPTAVPSSSNVTIPAATPAALSFAVASTSAFAYGDQVVIRANANPSANYMIGAVSCVNGSGINMFNSLVANANSCSSGQIKVVVEQAQGSGTHNNWSIENWTQTGITLCNATLGSSTSQNNTNPPLVRVARGNFALWAANERWQCLWREESSSPGENTGSLSGSTRANGNRAAHSGLYANSLSPNKTTSSSGRIANGLGSYDYVARVKSCVPGLLGGERCKQYPSGNTKPIGLLQYYGDSGQLHFGLMTGSHAKNISGGVLRKNVGSLGDEINAGTDGTFIQPATPPNSPRTSTSPATPAGIINSLNYLRIYGYNYGDGTYLGSSGDNCSWQLTNITENSCTSWGNPMSEVFYESLRYFAGASATSAYTFSNSGSKDNLLGLPLATWVDPLNTSNYCAPLNVLMINASVSSNDEDLGGTSMSGIGAASTASSLTDAVGSGEGLNGRRFFMGKSGGSNNELCDAKTLSGLGSAAGICPEGPTLQGSWLMAGLAHHARTQRIRSNISIPDNDVKSLKVSTYGVQLATNVPQIRVALEGEASPRVILQPAYRLFNSSPQGGGQLVDMKIVYQTATATTAEGMAYLNWEDSEQGGDYDQDVWGMISWRLDRNTNTLTVTTRTMAESTVQPQGFGYIVSGTTQDGPHFHSGIEGFNYTDPAAISVSPTTKVNGSGGCNNCQLSDAATTATYTLGAATAESLKDPLWYAAKWGGFTETAGANNLPDQVAEWDSRTASGSYGSDGVPDNYFLVSNPLGLEQALDRTFTAILEKAAASAVTTNSTSIRSDSRLYQARFNANGWSGQLLAYRIASTGAVSGGEEWDAATLLRTQTGISADSRTLITYGSSSRDGLPFTWTGISGQTAQTDALNRDAGGSLDNRGADRVAWLRGQSQHEGKSASQLRERTAGPLGDIVNSNPMYVGPPAAGYSDVDFEGYAAFANTWRTRSPMVWVGGNDGMLHGFNVKVGGANAGKEMLGYVPGAVYANLSQLMAQGYNHRYFVDGSPMVADAVVGGGWRSVLVGGLNAGGKGYFALDVTDPDTSFIQTRAAELALWEFTANDDADLGNSYNWPAKNLSNGQSRQIVRMNDGRWAVVVGNGYNSGAGKAALFILFLVGGTDGAWTVGNDYIKLVAESASASNGLSTPVPFDRNGDGKVDVIYAGDLKGNLWKFDVGNSSPSQWRVDLSGQPLFTARDSGGVAQPILAPPEITVHRLGGVMLLFGTGKYLEASDASSTAVQSFYGLWDRAGASGVSGTLAGEAIPGRQWLQGQSLNEYAAGSSLNGRVVNLGVRVPSGSAVVWCNAGSLASCESGGTPAAHLGWRLDLPASGERLTGIPQLLNGVIYFSTFIPSDAPCQYGGDGWLMALDYANGTLIPYPAFDTNGDGIMNLDSDARVGGVRTGAALGGATFLRATTATGQGVALLNRLTGDLMSIASSLGPGGSGRVSWHEVVE
ncbi:MAG: PilC/PilY family type IV pilus protein [Pseudomonadota bacterium]|nr:PilC/PilY family type IV pilus protein [Pseudomonadota bacterium]MDP1905714.1 PilC/PilY family type IV pilus protein [Pseudomonadota bacterium]MDP2353586.1 PilC/PilY family type IV pilus protein [Pseudomonadota bacterium]